MFKKKKFALKNFVIQLSNRQLLQEKHQTVQHSACVVLLLVVFNLCNCNVVNCNKNRYARKLKLKYICDKKYWLTHMFSAS